MHDTHRHSHSPTSGDAHGHDSGHHQHAHAHGSSAHGHSHSHAPQNFNRAFAIGIGLNTAFIVIEAVYGYLSNSMALLADAGHNLSDVLSLVVAWIAAVLVQRPPSPRYTYGLKSSSILAALFNAIILLVAVGAIAWQAILRFYTPEPIASTTVMVVATIGILINGFTAMLFMSGSKQDLNIRGAYLHMAADAAVSAGVVMAALCIALTGWYWIDPLTSLVIVAVIVLGTWGLLRDSITLSLNAVPAGIDPEAVRTYLCELPGVQDMHDLHIWSMSTTETALTAHLVMTDGHPGDSFLIATADGLKHRFGIVHATLQIETDPATACALAPNHVV